MLRHLLRAVGGPHDTIFHDLLGRSGGSATPGLREHTIPDRARELLTEAIALYRRIGMPKHVEMAEALLGEA